MVLSLRVWVVWRSQGTADGFDFFNQYSNCYFSITIDFDFSTSGSEFNFSRFYRTTCLKNYCFCSFRCSTDSTKIPQCFYFCLFFVFKLIFLHNNKIGPFHIGIRKLLILRGHWFNSNCVPVLQIWQSKNDRSVFLLTHLDLQTLVSPKLLTWFLRSGS